MKPFLQFTLWGLRAVLLIICCYAHLVTADIGVAIQGVATIQQSNLFSCSTRRSRPAPIGFKTLGEQTFTVPAKVNFAPSFFAADLYNDCSGVTPNTLNQADLSTVPVKVIDTDGEIITAYIFADNYFELYINGELIGVDAVPFTPFNSSVLRFQVKRPYDIALLAVDWEEHSGVGTESSWLNAQAGDAGLVTVFSDGTVTNTDWHAQTFYIAPLSDPNCVRLKGAARESHLCEINPQLEQNSTWSMHWAIPPNWQTSDHYTQWPQATFYSPSTIGVNNKSAYMNFRTLFEQADLIWSSNLVLDNAVLYRQRVE